jgi:hypothetical protein
MSYEEIADITGLADSTVKSRIHRARLQLCGLSSLRSGKSDDGRDDAPPPSRMAKAKALRRACARFPRADPRPPEVDLLNGVQRRSQALARAIPPRLAPHVADSTYVYRLAMLVILSSCISCFCRTSGCNGARDEIAAAAPNAENPRARRSPSKPGKCSLSRR